MKSQLRRMTAWLGILMGLGFVAPLRAAELAPEEAAKIAGEAYIYGYPLVLMDVSRTVMTAVPKPNTMQAPLNQFNDSQSFPDPSFTAVVSPNADTLYSSAWLDVSKEPIVLSVPDMEDRYYLMPMLSGWTNVFASPGTRTTGNKANHFAIVGPGFDGKIPDGVKEINAPTNMVWLIGRTQTNGPSDYAAVRALKAQYKLTPLSAWGTDYKPPEYVPVDQNVDRSAPVDQVARLDAATFFARLAALMKDNPPAPDDQPMLDKLAKIGFVPGEPFELAKLDPAIVAAIETGYREGQSKSVAEGHSLSSLKHVNGWAFSLDLGEYGTDYPRRAVTALVGLGANLAADAVYPLARTDGRGKPLSGANRYVLHFTKDQVPPVNGFWSLTMYNDRQFFVANPIDRYAIGNRDKLKFNDDGSLDLTISHESPGADKESNWLPAPADSFNVALRLYWPKPEVLDGKWTPPAITVAP